MSLLKSSNISFSPDRKRAFILQVLGGYANNAIGIIQGLLLVPLYIHYIGIQTYGWWLASGGIFNMLRLMNFGINSMLIQRIASAYGKQDLFRAGAYFFNGALVNVGICLLYGFTGWVISFWLPEILNVTGRESEILRGCFLIAVTAMAVGFFNECIRSLNQALLRPLIPVLSIIVGRILGTGVTIWMLLDNFQLWAIPSGMLVTEGIIFLINIVDVITFFLRLNFPIKIKKDIIIEYVQTGPALILARVGLTISQESEPLLINTLIGPEMNTAYMVTRRAADFIFQLFSVINGSIYSPFSHIAGAEQTQKLYTILKQILIISFSIGLIGFSIYAGINHEFVSLWINQSIVLNQDIILAIGIGYFLRSIRATLWQLLNGLGDFVFTSLIIFLESSVRMVVAITALTFFGVIGLPMALSISSFNSLILLSLRLKKRFTLQLDINTNFRFLLSVITLFGISLLATEYKNFPVSWGHFLIHSLLLTMTLLFSFISINWGILRSLDIKGKLPSLS
ncbi:O-antigen flippase Wzx [Dissulfuribacter thermophilus]|uniref:O-antigen flippase Wzx n=1 Tax=Dissulfuribacter thermophilus TaxID=1156395 RepID=A0A1B9F7U0_9BACT|nr:hypothetical protein [Dissulfuribacter thermophilus]OCC15875.1 O-antigen flippase Wzx [Dissulfuribacter thermophilus]